MNDLRDEGLHPGAPAPGTARYAAAVVTAILAAATIAGLLFLVARYWPYENFTAIPQTDVVNGGAEMLDDLIDLQRTEADLPIVDVETEGLYIDVEFCNPGYDLRIERWFDRYMDNETAESTPAEFDEPSLSYLFRLQEAQVPDRVCPVEAPVPVDLPDDLPPGIYRLRVEYIYKPNVFAPERNEQLRTEPFHVVEDAP